jgi:hypothetical protein
MVSNGNSPRAACPLWVKSGRQPVHHGMSALPPESRHLERRNQCPLSATSRHSKGRREDSVGLVEASNSDARERWPAERAYDVPVSSGVGGAKQRERLRRLG